MHTHTRTHTVNWYCELGSGCWKSREIHALSQLEQLRRMWRQSNALADTNKLKGRSRQPDAEIQAQQHKHEP